MTTESHEPDREEPEDSEPENTTAADVIGDLDYDLGD